MSKVHVIYRLAGPAVLISASLLRQVRLCFAGTGREIINSDQRETTRRTTLTKNYVMSRKIIEFIDRRQIPRSDVPYKVLQRKAPL